MSLGSWFRDYVYIPLGGNKVKKCRHLFNIFVVWFLTGFWHGAEWNFIIWGLYFGILLTLEKFFLLKNLEKHKIFSHIYVLFFIAVSFVIFSANNLNEAITSVGGMFGFGVPFASQEFFYYLKNFGVVLLISAVAATPAPKKLKAYLDTKKWPCRILDVLEIPVLLILLLVCTAFLADGSFNPFLYFRF